MLSAYGGVAVAVDVSALPMQLKSISANVLPGLKDIAVDVWNNPGLAHNEHHALGLVVDYFTKVRPGDRRVTPHAYGMLTVWNSCLRTTRPAASRT